MTHLTLLTSLFYKHLGPTTLFNDTQKFGIKKFNKLWESQSAANCMLHYHRKQSNIDLKEIMCKPVVSTYSSNNFKMMRNGDSKIEDWSYNLSLYIP